MAHMFENIEDHADLINRLHMWRNFGHDEVYDYGGMVQLFAACLDNLREMAVDGELKDITNFLDDEQKEFLQTLAQYSKLPCAED